MAERVTIPTGAAPAAREVTEKAGAGSETRFVGGKRRVLAAEQEAGTAHAAIAAERALAATPVTVAVATAAADAEMEAGAGAELKRAVCGGSGAPEDIFLFAVDDGVSDVAAARLSADLHARAAAAAADGEDEDALECTVMKRGNYWPYFWSQRLLVVERRSLLYFATPLPAAGAVPRGFFPLQPNTRLLFSVDRVSLYGRTDGLLLGIFNAPLSTAASVGSWLPASSPSPAAAPLLLSPTSLTSNWSKHARYRPLHLPRKRPYQLRQGADVSGEYREGDLRSPAPPQLVSPHVAACAAPASARRANVSNLTVSLSILLAPFRSLFPWIFFPSGGSYQPTVRDTPVDARAVGDVAEPSAAFWQFSPSFTTASGASSFFASSASCPPPHCLPSPFSSSAFSANAPVESSAVSLWSASPAFNSFAGSSAASASGTGMSVSTVFPCGRSSLESASVPSFQRSCDVVKNTRKRSSRQSPTAGGVFWEAEDAPASAVNWSSAVASTAAAPFLSVSRSSSAPSCEGGTVSSGSFFSLPSTPSFPLLSCSSSPSHSSPATASSGLSECCPPVSVCRGSRSSSSPIACFSNTTSASHLHSSTSSAFSSSFSSGLTFPAAASAGTTSSLLSTFASSGVTSYSAAATPAPNSSRTPVSPVPAGVSCTVTKASSSVPLLSSAFHSRGHLASLVADADRTTSSERTEAMRRATGAAHDRTEHRRLKEQRKLQQEQRQLQQSRDLLQQPVQQRHQRLQQWQHQKKSCLEKLRTGAQTPHDSWTTDKAAVAVEPEIFLQSGQMGNLSEGGLLGGSPPCRNSHRSRTSQDRETDTRGFVASDPPRFLACSQETFAKEFDKAPKPKFLFEFADQAEQRQVACAIARAILRIRRQARRKHQQQRQRLQERLNEGLHQREQEPSAAQQSRCIRPGDRRQHVRRGVEEPLEQLSLLRQQKLLRRSQEQSFQRPLEQQHIQVEHWTVQRTSRCERSGFQKELCRRGHPLPNSGTSWERVGGIGLSSARPDQEARGDPPSVIWRDARREERLDLPRLMKHSHEARMLTRVPSVTAGRVAAGSNVCGFPATAVGAKVNQVIIPRQGRSCVECGRPQPSGWRNTHQPNETHRDMSVSERYGSGCIRRSSFSHPPTTNVTAANRSHSDDDVSVLAERRRTPKNGVGEDMHSPEAGSPAAGKDVDGAGAHGRQSAGGVRRARQSDSSYTTAPVPSQRRTVGHAWESWAHENANGSSCTERHAGGGLTEIVSELLGMLLSPEGMRCLEYVRANEQCTFDRGHPSHKREEWVTTHRFRRRVETVLVEERGTTEQLLEERREPQLCEDGSHKASELKPQHVAPTQHKSDRNMARHAPQASKPHLLGGREQRGETLTQEEDRYIRLVRALTRLRNLVARHHAGLLQRGRNQRALQTYSFDCWESETKGGVLPASPTKGARRQRSASSAILQEASDELYKASQNFVLGNVEPTSAPRTQCASVKPSPRRIVTQVTPAARSYVHGEANVTAAAPADGTGGVTRTGEFFSGQTLTRTFASSKDQCEQQVSSVELTQQESQDHLSAHVLQQHRGAFTASRAQQQEGDRPSSPVEQRVRAANLLLLEQREQVERLESVVDFLMRERELQLRWGYQVNEAELQQQWEEEQRRFEAERQQSPLVAADLLQLELNAYEEPERQHLVSCEAKKEVANCVEEQLWDFSIGRESAVGALSLRDLAQAEIFAEGQQQAISTARQSGTRQGGSKQPQDTGKCSPIQKAAVRHGNSLPRRKRAHQRKAPGGADVEGVPVAEAGLLAGGSQKSSNVGRDSYVEMDNCGNKGCTMSTASASLEDRETRVIESDTQDNENSRNKHLVKHVEPPIIFRISTPPSSSRESVAGETSPERSISREGSTLQLRHQSSY